MTQRGFHKEFYWYGQWHQMHVVTYCELTNEEITQYAAEEGQFLVHLFDGAGYKSFLVFYDEKLEWNSNVSRIVLDDRDLIEKIGFLIDDVYA